MGRNKVEPLSTPEAAAAPEEQVADSQMGSNEQEAREEPKQESESKMLAANLEGDKLNICVLIFLYILQGIPLGLGQAIPLILTKHNVSYREQAGFSFAGWPFALKLLWAPIVDSIYVARFGRRKSWLVPVQYLIGITMLTLSWNVDYYIGTGIYEEHAPQVPMLTGMFFFLNFLAATQDVAVDGWALTMLKRRNVGYASTCNSAGQTTGVFLGFILFLVLEGWGWVNLSQFLFFWGIVFLCVTTLVAIFKHEKKMSEVVDVKTDEYHEPDLNPFQMYKLLFKIVILPNMPIIIIFLLTARIGTSAADAVSGLKLIEKGMPKDKLAMVSIPLIPMQVLFTFLITPLTTGPKPMDVFLYAAPARLLSGMFFVLAVYLTPLMEVAEEEFPWYYYGMIIAIHLVYQCFAYAQFVATMAFFARISDPAIGGTYMTMLNTITNLGSSWSSTFALWLVDFMTKKECHLASGPHETNVCDGSDATNECKDLGGSCLTLVEGYYIEMAGCCIVGFIWLLWAWPTMKRIQAISLENWKVIEHSKKEQQA